MDPKELFNSAVEQAWSCVKRVEKSELGNATPCSKWDLRKLLNHMVYELLWVPELLQGKTVKEVGDKYDGDVLDDDVQAAWSKAVDVAREAVEAADLKATVHLSYADVTAEHYIREIGGDILIHGWDAGQAINCSLMFEPKVAQAIYDNILPRKDEFAGSGLFGKPIDVPDDASIQTKLLALVGRKATA